MKIQLWPIDNIRPYARNARKITEKAVDKVAMSIKTFGWRQPIVVDREGVIVIGHVRRLAAMKLGYDQVPVHVAESLTPAEIRQLRLMDNRAHEETEFDIDLLRIEVLELKDIGVDLNLTGFDSHELDSLFQPTNDDRADDAPPLPRVPVSRDRDLWSLERHKLLVGDATNRADILRLCGDTKADALWMDPPFGVGYAGKTERALTIQGDDKGSVEAMMVQVLSALKSHVVPSAPFYIAHPAGALALPFARAIDVSGWRIHQGLVWYKDSMVLGHSDYHYQHEPILYGFAPGEGRPGRGKRAGSRWYGDNSQVSVFNIPRPKRSSEHPTMKPVSLVRRCLCNSVPRGGSVIDPFMGSGTTLIAAELTGRIAFGTEIDPKYADVVIERWQKLTGKEAMLEGTRTTFAQLRKVRGLEVGDTVDAEPRKR